MKRFIFFVFCLFMLFTSCSFSNGMSEKTATFLNVKLSDEASMDSVETILYSQASFDTVNIVKINGTEVALPLLPTEKLNTELYKKISEFLLSLDLPYSPKTLDFYTSEGFDTKTYTFFVCDTVDSYKNLKFYFSYDTESLKLKEITDFMSKDAFTSLMLNNYNLTDVSVEEIEVLYNGINIYVNDVAYFISENSFEKEKTIDVFFPQSYNPVTDKNEKYVALTFDDGPNPNSTANLLKTLKENDVKATFFMVGYNIEEYPYLVKKVYEDGHDIGVHSYGHTNYSLMPFDEVLKDIDKCSNLIYSAVGKRPYLVRPPFGSIKVNEIDTEDYFFVNWNVDPTDWKLDNPELIAQEAIKHSTSGSIILLHDIYNVSCEAAEIIIKTLKEQGYRFVTISEYFDLNGKKPDNKLHFRLEDYNV